MKKYIFMAVAGMLALSSCSNDDNDIQDVQNAPRQMTFTAGFGDEAQTRATLDGSTKKVSFDAGDEISILSTKNTNTAFTTEYGGASATFTGTAANDSKFYAIYPYKAYLTLNSNTGVISNVIIPPDQSAAASSACGWDPAAPIAYATTTGLSLTFHNACALLKITNDYGDAEFITISANESVAGTFTLNTTDGSLSYGSTNMISVDAVPNGKTIYIAIAPGTYTGFSTYFKRSGYSVYKTKSKANVTFEKGKIYNLGNVSVWDNK